MKIKASKVLASASAIVSLTLAPASATTVTFESLLSTPNTFRNGSDVSGQFTSEGVNFLNNYYPSYDGFSGFAISNTTDTTTPGYGNQFSAFPGSGAGGSSAYAVAYDSSDLTFSAAFDLTGLGASITNTTYAALSMLNGDQFAKKFGGVTGNDPDFFKLTISGSIGGVATGTPVDFYLADFRFSDNMQDYIVNQWTPVDFSPLGTVDKISFSFDSSDRSGIFLNTPTYFAMDNLTAVPEPSALCFLFLSGFGLLVRRR
jgi:Domain of unknown function (DUF4465)